MLKRLVYAVIVVAGSSSVALADGYNQPRGYAPAIAQNWSGFYLGGSVGDSWQTTDWRYTNPTPPFCCASFSATDSVGVYGAHAGLQRQFGSLVIGVEGGGIFKFDDQSTSKTGCIGGGTQTCAARIGDLAVVGPRLGFAHSGFLFYGTGGYATGEVRSRVVNANGSTFDTTSARQDGWFLGGGVEHKLTPNIVVGVEYQHVDLGTSFHASSADAFGPSPPGVNGRDIGATEDIVRARLSYKFGDFFRRYEPLK